MGEWDLARLEAEYGPFEVREETFTKSRAEFERLADLAARGALGGARVLVERGDRILLVRVRDGFDGWDVVGGKREPGERPEETARREAREEVGLDVTLAGVSAVNRFSFEPADGDGRVSGLWVLFEGTCEGTALDVQESELRDARWFAEPPGTLNRHVADRVARWTDDEP